MGMCSSLSTMKTSDRPTAPTMIRLLAQIFAMAISKGVTGMTRRCSTVPCSRSRTTAAPARMIASMVVEEMTPMTLVNQAVTTLGLKAMRTTWPIGAGGGSSWRVRNLAISSVRICCGVAGADPRLHHGGGVDIDLQDRAGGRATQIALEMGRDIEDERVGADIHQPVDVASARRCGRAGNRAAERRGRAAPDNSEWSSSTISDRGVVQFLGIALRLGDDRQRKGIDHQAEQHPVAEEAAQFLGSQPENIAQALHRSSPVCAAGQARAPTSAGKNSARIAT